MREMKDSHDSWIGYIPKTWETKRIKEFLVERKDTCSVNDNYDLLAVSEYYGVAKKADVISDNEFITHAESLEGYKVCRPDDLVMNIMLAWKRAMGVSKYTGITSPAYCVFSPRETVCMQYFHHLFRTDFYASLFKQYSTGIIDSRLRLYPDKFLALRCHFPPLNEQQRIADFLDRRCADIDNVLEKTKASIEEYRKLKRSVITEAVTKGVRGPRPMKDSGIEWIGEIPDEWTKYRKLSSICKKGISYGIVKLFDPDENGVKVLRCSDVQPGYILTNNIRTVTKALSDEYKRTILQGGEIIINVRGTLGGCAIVPEEMKGYNIAREVALIDADGINKKYLMFFFLSDTFKLYQQLNLAGSVYVGLNIELLASCPILRPSEEEQQEIASYLDQKCSEIDSLIESKERFIKELETYRKNLIYEYVTGKKEVPA